MKLLDCVVLVSLFLFDIAFLQWIVVNLKKLK